ncbi:MAG: D-glycero-beta-D-manno-heptose 1-phosphate adenylyltransferase [Aquificae bacterium]|nr:D-glycero-beta-D-manno-heptose 1-phosphate adenylyltransferase [Aquificota bacterium]
MPVSLEELLSVLEEERKKGKRVVFTNGCFDIIHAGHVDYLKKAKALGDILVVGMNSDESVRRIKGSRRPVIPQELRAVVLEALKPVDYVVVFEEDTPEKLIKAIRPDVLVKGGDWPLDRIVGREFVESYGGKVLTIPFEYDISTTKIIEKILSLYCG